MVRKFSAPAAWPAVVRKYGEEGKVALRNIRRDAMDDIKKKTKKSELTEDDQKKLGGLALHSSPP